MTKPTSLHYHYALGIALSHEGFSSRYTTGSPGDQVKQCITDGNLTVARIVSFPTGFEGLEALATAPGIDSPNAKVRQDGLRVELLHEAYEERIRRAFKDAAYQVGPAEFETRYQTIPQRSSEKPSFLSVLFGLVPVRPAPVRQNI